MEKLNERLRCKAFTVRGRPCKRYAINGSDYCSTHDEEARKTHSQAMSKWHNKRDPSLIIKLPYLRVDNLDSALEFTKQAIEKMAVEGLRYENVPQYVSLVRLLGQLEKDILVPKKIKELEKIIDKQNRHVAK